ncbi:AraC-like protein [Fontibacillus phaseoli]|uniref:AraC-like protein n=1 Tax=Fontibacillus phaseoli TaxID=1416533 RepID=A0A369B7B7_9BACL|nr:AraC family transcriptional regulator [Fontibacillus phaseoli]RCX16427.1 AraC-like protein [Fontibacillus phaseoli]
MKDAFLFSRTEETTGLPVFMTTVGYWRHQSETDRPSGFPDYQLHQVLSGQGNLRLGEDEYLVGPGDVFFLFPGIPHRYMPVSTQWEMAWVSFQGRESNHLLSYAGINSSGVGKLRSGTLLKGLERMLSMEGKEAGEFEVECSKQLYSLFLDLKKLLIEPAGRNEDLERMKPVLRYIAQHLHRPLPLAELAEIASVSPQYLCRLFQKTMKMRPLYYVNQERISLSKKLMFSERNKKIYEIAHQVGYENSSYFCAVFKRHTGMSPEDFKKLHGLNP